MTRFKLLDPKKTKEPTLHLIVLLALAISLLVIISIYVNNTQKYETSYVTEQLEVIAKQNATMLEIKLETSLLTIKTLAKVLAASPVIDESLISQTCAETDFLRLAVIYKDETIISSSKTRDISTYSSVFVNDMNGKSGISPIVVSKDTNKEILVIYSPLFKNEKVIGMLFGVYETDYLSEIMYHGSEEFGGYAYAFDKSGKMLSFVSSDQSLFTKSNIWDALTLDVDIAVNYDILQMRLSVAAEATGFLEYSKGKEERMAYYCPINFQNWYVMSVLPKEVITNQTSTLTAGGIRIVMILSIIFIAAYSLFVVYSNHHRNELLAVQNKLQHFVESYNIIIHYTSNTIFEYDIKNRCINHLSSNEVQKFIFGSSIDFISIDKLLQNEMLPKESRIALKECFSAIDSGQKEATCIVEINYMSEIHWIKNSLVSVININGKLDRAVGVWEDITAEKEKEEKLRFKAERDQLTDLLNRNAAENIINKIIDRNPHSLHGFIMMDLDGFKQVNDTLGHIMGDEILKLTSKKLIEIFRSSDVIARLGGDEFIIFMEDPKSEKIIISRTKKLVEAIRSIVIENYKDNKSAVTCSIGVSLFSKDGKTFKELYSSADLALYYTKNNGKNGYTMFDPSLEKKMNNQ